jgi:hypothetical protein
MSYIQTQRTSEEYLTRREATPSGRAGGRAHARICAQKNRKKIRGNDGEEER